MRKGPGRHDTWFRVICITKQIQDGGSLTVRTFKERFLRFQLLFPDFYHFHHVIWGMKWAKKLKTKNRQNMSSGPFSHDAAQIIYFKRTHSNLYLSSRHVLDSNWSLNRFSHNTRPGHTRKCQGRQTKPKTDKKKYLSQISKSDVRENQLTCLAWQIQARCTRCSRLRLFQFFVRHDCLTRRLPRK